MNFRTKEDIAATIDVVFAAVSDFDGFERTALRRGAAVQRTSPPALAGKGMTWDLGFAFRGKPRTMTAELTVYDPPQHLVCRSETAGIDGTVIIDLLALSPNTTRLSVDLVLAPRTLSARLLVQSLKLAKAKLNRRFKRRVAEFAAEVEDRHNPRLS